MCVYIFLLVFVGKTQNIYFCFIIISTPLWAYQELYVSDLQEHTTT